MAVSEMRTDSDLLAVCSNYGPKDITVVSYIMQHISMHMAENHNHNGGDSIIHDTRSDSEHTISMIV